MLQVPPDALTHGLLPALTAQGRARHLIFSGAHPGGVVATTKRTEANVMRELAEEQFGTHAALYESRHVM